MSTAQDITLIRESILRNLLPLVAVATYPETLARLIRRDGCPDATAASVTSHLQILAGLGKVETVAADRAGGTLSAADTGWKLTAEGIRTAEQLAYS